MAREEYWQIVERWNNANERGEINRALNQVASACYIHFISMCDDPWMKRKAGQLTRELLLKEVDPDLKETILAHKLFDMMREAMEAATLTDLARWNVSSDEMARRVALVWALALTGQRETAVYEERVTRGLYGEAEQIIRLGCSNGHSPLEVYGPSHQTLRSKGVKVRCPSCNGPLRPLD